MLIGRGFEDRPLTEDQLRRIAESHEELNSRPMIFADCADTGRLKHGRGYCKCKNGCKLTKSSVKKRKQ
jgi:hypothetical protein